ncbi:hypothetical protein C8046_05245 [Serinibacter arcticus]|uniref:Single-stranded DNA-binding protein n=1 Tax=Serinibacter arcticus TaxID=1655435 RepID=A0A2U1ZT47_9MICO|nr:single-stranded DNA-binding protein [Serinibacter arcticus]PWD50159.1 hypothetical protein C8046_05245 [Serinibacter arcticus]
MSGTTITMRGLAGSVPELRMSAKQNAWTSFRLASTPSRRNADGAWEDLPTMWVTVTVFKRLAEHVAATVRKGMPLTVVGSLSQDEWIGADGVPRSGLAIEARSVALDLQGPGTFVWSRGDQPSQAGESAHTAAGPAPQDYGTDPGPVTDQVDEAAGQGVATNVSHLVTAGEEPPF